MEKIRIGIVGYGNIGRGVEKAICRNDDMELKAVFTRRDPSSVKIATEDAVVKSFDEMLSMKDEIDVMMLCGGSATDLPVMGPQVVENFNIIDSFDTHAKSRHILKMWINQQKVVGTLGLFLSAGTQGCFL